MTPLNDLERLLAKPKLGPQDYPELFRLLRETELVFLLPYHPELEGEALGVQNGDPLPPFVVWSSPQSGPRVPIFSSLDRAQEACRKTGAKDNAYALCDMPGQHLFQLLACQHNGIAINPATTFQAIMLDLEGVKQIAAEPVSEHETGPNTRGRVKLLTPADYPTKLVQSLFQYLRGSSGVRAAWLAKDLTRTEPGTSYIIMLLGEFDRAKVKDGIIIVAGSAINKDETVYVGFLDEDNTEALTVAQKFTPFYAAPDYQSPSPLAQG